MKVNIWASLFLISLIIIFSTIWLDKLLKEVETNNRSDIDSWIDEIISKELSYKINSSKDHILETLNGDFDSELVNKINNTISSVKLIFNRLSSNRDIQIVLNIKYVDNQLVEIATKRNWDLIPEPVRAEFIRGGRNTIERIWELPWNM